MNTQSIITYIEMLGGGQGLLLLLAWLRSPARRGWAGIFLTLLLALASAAWVPQHDVVAITKGF